MDEDGLADAFRTGSAEGVRAVYERYSGAVFTIALRVLGDRELAADAVQVTFLNAWRACGSLEPGRPMAPWLFTIARRAAIDLYRRRAHGPEPVEPRDDATITLPPSMECIWEAWQIRIALDRVLDGRGTGGGQGAALRGPHPRPDRPAAGGADRYGEVAIAPSAPPAGLTNARGTWRRSRHDLAGAGSPTTSSRDARGRGRCPGSSLGRLCPPAGAACSPTRTAGPSRPSACSPRSPPPSTASEPGPRRAGTTAAVRSGCAERSGPVLLPCWRPPRWSSASWSLAGPRPATSFWRARGWHRERARRRSCTPRPQGWPSSWTSPGCRPPRRAPTTRPG